MQIIELDATSWKTLVDFYDTFRSALGAPEGYATNLDGLLEMMIWDYADPVMVAWHRKHDKANAPQPPYTIRIINAKDLPKNINSAVESLYQFISISRAEFLTQEGHDIDVRLEIIP
jgi:RNAse (barnase) inhibitor barstar